MKTSDCTFNKTLPQQKRFLHSAQWPSLRACCTEEGVSSRPTTTRIIRKVSQDNKVVRQVVVCQSMVGDEWVGCMTN